MSGTHSKEDSSETKSDENNVEKEPPVLPNPSPNMTKMDCTDLLPAEKMGVGSRTDDSQPSPNMSKKDDNNTLRSKKSHHKSETMDPPEISDYEKLCLESHHAYTEVNMHDHRLELVHQYVDTRDDKTHHYILMARRKNRYHTIQVSLKWNNDANKNDIYFTFLIKDTHATIRKGQQMVYNVDDPHNIISLTNTFIFKFKPVPSSSHMLLYSNVNNLKKQCSEILTESIKKIKDLKYTIQKVITIIFTYIPILELGRKIIITDLKKLENHSLTNKTKAIN